MNELFQYVTGVQATAKVLNLWNGSSNDPPPAGFFDPGFDDSAWPTSSSPFVALGSLGDLEQALAPWVTPPSATAQFIMRQHFATPASPWRFYGPVDLLNGNAFTLAINGTSLAEFAEDAPFNPIHPTPGADNVIVMVGTALSVGEGWVAFRVTFYTRDLREGTVFAWGTPVLGVSDNGVMGVGDTLAHLTPVPIGLTLPATICKVVSNGKTSLFLDTNGDVYACGDNTTGIVGYDGTAGYHPDSSPHATPIKLPFRYIADVCIGDDCAITIDRYSTIITWGVNAHGSFGDGTTTPGSAVPLNNTNTLGILCRGPGFPDIQIAAGKHFTVFGTGTGLTVAGENTYGQLSRATSGPDVITRNIAIGFPIGVGQVTYLSAGADNMLVTIDTGAGTVCYGCGRAELGALDSNLYAAGTGAAHIVNTLTQLDHFSGRRTNKYVQAGPVAFQFDKLSEQIQALGDGTPYGGTAAYLDFNGEQASVVWGVDNPTSAGVKRNASFDTFLSFGIAEINGGSQNNPYTFRSSLAVYAAIADKFIETLDPLDIGVNSEHLYTWGWGGAGQMGSGHDSTSNLLPVSENGLEGVSLATVAEGIMFAISRTFVPPIPRTGRSFVTVIGD